MALYF